MNLNPADGHVMDYTTGWATDSFIGSYSTALTKDYLNPVIWRHPVRYIAIVRHQQGEVDAVKVFRFKDQRSMLARFQDMDPGRRIETEGGPLQESVGATAQNLGDDPIFSVGGDLAFNWGYSNNGCRIALTSGHLSEANVNDDNTHGLGNHFLCNPKLGTAGSALWPHEISNIQDCPLQTCKNVKLQGTDHGAGSHLKSGPVYGNYAIYVSEDATTFPTPGTKLGITVEVKKNQLFFEEWIAMNN